MDILKVVNVYQIIPNKWAVNDVLKFSSIIQIASIIERGESFNLSDLEQGRGYQIEPD